MPFRISYQYKDYEEDGGFHMLAPHRVGRTYQIFEEIISMITI